MNIEGVNLETVTKKEWKPVFLQVYRDVLANNPGRVEIFNGNYGLNRGLGGALIVLAALFLIAPPHQYLIALGLTAAGLVYLIRMQRFGVHFATEVFNGFLNLPRSAAHG